MRVHSSSQSGPGPLLQLSYTVRRRQRAECQARPAKFEYRLLLVRRLCGSFQGTASAQRLAVVTNPHRSAAASSCPASLRLSSEMESTSGASRRAIPCGTAESATSTRDEMADPWGVGPAWLAGTGAVVTVPLIRLRLGRTLCPRTNRHPPGWCSRMGCLGGCSRPAVRWRSALQGVPAPRPAGQAAGRRRSKRRNGPGQMPGTVLMVTPAGFEPALPP
jgi:hypothetical protein